MHPILGRDADLAAAVALLHGGARLVTVTGPGGVGKTRFALEAAALLARTGGQAVVWVPLSELTRPDEVPAALAGSLGLWSTGPAPLDAVVEHLRRSPVLLVLDNFEHVAAAGPVVDRLLVAATGTRVLVTSRTVLHVHGEHQHPLAPLAVDGDGDGDGPAEELLRARVRAVRPDLVLDGPALAAVRRICRAVDGLPLALELAAARAAVLPLTTIADQLEAAPADLEAPADAVGGHRHRSLRALVRWSADLLSPDARDLLARLSVFRGGFTVDAATAVADHDGRFGGRVPELLAQLRDASLVTADGPARLRMLAMVRECAVPLLDEDEARPLGRAHGTWCAHLLDEATGGLPVQLPTTAAARTGLPETDNVRAALSAARDAGDAALLADLAQVHAQLVEVGGSAAEALAWIDEADQAAAQAPGAVPAARTCDLLLWRSRLTRDTGSVADSLDHARAALGVAQELGDADRTAQATMLLAYWLAWFGDREAAAEHEQRLRTQMTAGDVRFPGYLRGLVGLVSSIRVDDAAAEADLRGGLIACRAAGEDLQALIIAGMLSETLLVTGRAADALDVLAEWDLHALADLVPRAAAYPLANRLVAALALGDTARAETDLPVALLLADRSGDVVLMLELLRVLAAVAARDGGWDDVLLLLAGFAAHVGTIGGDLQDASASTLVVGLEDEAARRLGPDRAAALRLAGAASRVPALWDVARRVADDHLRR